MRATAIGLAIVVLGSLPDVLPPGHKPVEHLMTVEVAPELATWRFVAMPTRGFSGVHVIDSAQPFPFSSKYGTRIYALARDEPLPTEFDRAWCAAHPASPPFEEVVSVPLLSPLQKLVTTYRIRAVAGANVVVDKVGERRFWSTSWPDVATALLLTILIELAVVAAIARRGNRGALLRTAALINLVTHPIATGLVVGVPGLATQRGILLVEAGVLLAEAGGYRWLMRLPTGRAVMIAALANLASYLTGVVVSATMM